MSESNPRGLLEELKGDFSGALFDSEQNKTKHTGQGQSGPDGGDGRKNGKTLVSNQE